MRILFLSLSFLLSTTLSAQLSNFWASSNENSIILDADNDRGFIPSDYHTFSLDVEGIKTYLQAAPMERTTEGLNQPLILELPLPDGDVHQFKVVESPVMQPGIAARYSDIKSYKGYSTRDETVQVRFMYSVLGFHAMFYSPTARYYIQPYAKNMVNTCIVYDRKNQQVPDGFAPSCGVHNTDEFLNTNSALEGMEFDLPEASQASGRSAAAAVQIHEYTMAVAGVSEWVNTHGGTVAGGMAAVNIVANLLNSVFEPEAAVRFILIDDNDQLIYIDQTMDPYQQVTDGGGLLQQNQDNLDLTIGNENYDIGHVMTIGCANGLGGIAGGTVCSPSGKGRGVTCQGGNNLEYIILEIATHEVAHQFTGGHTWDNCPGILDQRSPGTAFEPGSGSTILSYSGSCGDQNVQFNSDTYFHVGSLQNIFTHTRFGGGADCPNIIPASNNLPELELAYENGFYIPISTPFELIGNATDEDNDNLTYCWEQYNTGPLSQLGTPLGTAPSFRSYPAVPENNRVFPRMQSVVQNTQQAVEVLPSYTRNLTFRCTVRDNNPEIGGVVWDEVSFEATDQAGPFRVEYPNSNVILEIGEYVEVLWDVANTDAAPVNCERVNIKLSNNGGYDYPFTLATNVPNDGAQFVTMPNVITGGARIRVEAADNIFFDLSNFNFQIVEPTTPGYAFVAEPFYQQICAPDNIEIDLSTISMLDYDSLVTLSIAGLPAGANAMFSSNPITPSENGTLTIETSNVVDEGFYEFELTAIAQGGDTLVRNVTVDIVLNDFSDLAPLTPENGSSSVSEVPEFTWVPSPNAVSYDLDIATNPSFEESTILESVTGLTGTSYTSGLVFEKNTLFFWRIRPQNECGSGVFSAPQGFHTEVFECSVFENNTQVNISGVGTPIVESTLLVNSSGTINDLNVTKIKGAHDLVQHLDVSLISPDNTEVVLFNDICGVATAFNMGLDDESPLDIQCPPNNGGIFRPQGSLTDFNNLEATGVWTIKIAVNNADGVGGSLEKWSLQLCSNASANPPYLVTNDLMSIPPGSTKQITDEFLLSEDDDNGPEDLTYTVVTAPENGTLFFLGNQPVEVGMTFRQITLNAGNLTYSHNGGPETTDGFTFAVEDGEGGWYGTPRFEIELDPNAPPVGTEDLEVGNDFAIFPNPAQEALNLKFDNPINDQLEVYITNVQGQVLQSQVFDNVIEQVEVNTSKLSNGIYFIYVKNGDASAITKKFVIQK